MANEAYLFRIVGCRCRKWQLREGVGSKISCLSLNVSEGGLWCLPAKPAFLLCDGSTTENREQRTDNSRQIGARNVTFQKSSHFSKISETVTAILLTKIDESSKLLRWVPRWDGHPVGVLEMSLLNRFGRRTERQAAGTRSSNCYLSKIFTPGPLEIFSNSNAFQ